MGNCGCYNTRSGGSMKSCDRYKRNTGAYKVNPGCYERNKSSYQRNISSDKRKAGDYKINCCMIFENRERDF
jgi:hypothetical protein